MALFTPPPPYPSLSVCVLVLASSVLPQTFCEFGGTKGLRELDNVKFAKLCKETGLVDRLCVAHARLPGIRPLTTLMLRPHRHPPSCSRARPLSLARRGFQ